MTGSSSLPWALGRGRGGVVCMCEDFRVAQMTQGRIIKSKMPPVDKESPGKNAYLRVLRTEASLSRSLVLLLPVLLLLSVSFLSGLIFLSPPTTCHSLYPLTLIPPRPLAVALLPLSTPSPLQQMNPAT